MMPQKMLEQPLNWPGISLSMAQGRLVYLTCVFAFLKIMRLEQIVTDNHFLLLPFFKKNRSVIQAEHSELRPV